MGNTKRGEKVWEKVRQLVEEYKRELIRGYSLMHRAEPKTEEETVSFLVRLFREEEEEIREQQENSRFTTDYYENDIRTFAGKLWEILTEYYSALENCADFLKLLRCRHVAEAFYSQSDKNHGIIGKMKAEDCFWTEGSEEALYLGLADFYANFYGSFGENEKAIRLLCTYYPQSPVDLSEQEDEIAEAFRRHIKNAGTPTDFGYAFNGIAIMRQLIGRLPASLVLKIIKKYSLYEVLYTKISRHQLYTLIQYSQIKNKENIKFLYLDSLMLAHQINVFLSKEMETEDNIKTSPGYSSYELKLEQEKIWVFDEPKGYWETDCRSARWMKLRGKTTQKITLQGEKIVVFRNGQRVGSIPYHYDDWQLEDYRKKEIEQILYKAFTETNGLKYNQMLFSFLYLNNYHNMQEQAIDFDHRFCYVKEENRLKRRAVKDNIPHFYGKTVCSCTCLVGKNGMGKTSIVDFLRENFFELLLLISSDKEEVCKDGYVQPGKVVDKRGNVIIGEDVQFLIVFWLGSEAYSLSNIEGMRTEGVIPYTWTALKSANEISKIIYFSQQIRSDQKELAQLSKNFRKEKGKDAFRQYDYSEAKSMTASLAAQGAKERENAKTGTQKEGFINKEFCYQMTLLRHTKPEKLCEWLDMKTPEREICIYDIFAPEKTAQMTLKELATDEKKQKEIEQEFMMLPGTRFGYFSSGQYEKFVFLAKLYWFLKGYQTDIAYYEEIVGKNSFSVNEALLQGETALIFIDEGEVYYHPEWQRNYVNTLLQLLNTSGEKDRIQVILTTNSPFIISDMLSEDIIYLPCKNESDEKRRTLGQNIHELLRNSFFMENTIGEYSKQLIGELIQWLGNDEESGAIHRKRGIERYFGKEVDEYQAISTLIAQIGEPIYRTKLQMMLEEHPTWKKKKELEKLEKEKQELEEKIKQLKSENA